MKNTLITSSENPRYKGWIKLLRRKYRDLEDRFIVEGPLLLEDAVKSGGNLLELVFSSHEENPEALIEKLGFKGEVFLLPDELYKKITSTENGRSALGIFEIPGRKEYVPINSSNVLVLDKIQDPGNLGTIIRTADGAGFREIILTKGTTDPFSPKVVRAAAGSIFRVSIREMDDNREIIDYLKERKLNILVTRGEAKKDYWDRDLTEPQALIIGNEGQGVCEDFEEIPEAGIRIPMSPGIESLNAGISAGIVMYEIIRQQSHKKDN